MAENVFDQFDASAARSRDAGNVFDQFDEAEVPRAASSKAPELSTGEEIADVGEQAVRGTSKGIVGAVTLPYEAVRYLLDKGISIPGIGSASPGIKLPAAADMPLYKPFLQQPEPLTDAGRYARAAGEAVGSNAVPAAGIMAKAPQLAKLAPTTLPRAFGQAVGENVAAAPGRAAALDVTAATGAGLAQESAREAEFGPGWELAAGVAGGAAPVTAIAAAERGLRAAYGVASPTLARWSANREALRRRYGISASADGGLPENAGSQAAAEQIVANQLQRANVRVDDLRAILSNAERARRFHSNSYAQDALAPVDLDPSLRRLAGSVGRSSPEAANVAERFMFGRQSGLTPADGELPASAGIPTRPMFARPQPGETPAGQYERVRDALKRAMLIRDEDFHGHAASAYRTEQAILEAAREEAKTLYSAAYSAGQNLDIRPSIKPVLEQWADRAAGEPAPVAKAIQRAMGLFASQQGPVSNIERFDKAKQFMDGLIEGFFDSPVGRNRYLGGVLTQFKNDMLAAVDGIKTSDLGTKYKAARNAFSSRMEARDALRLGRDVFRENSEVAVDNFVNLTSPGDQKLFRLGLLGSFEQHMGRQKRTADITQIFESPRVQEILNRVIPRTETATGRARVVGGAPAEFADRPERFGEYLQNEKRMVQTRNEVLGNSKTAQRLADDQAFEDLSSVVEKFRSSPSVWNVGIKAAEYALNKMFGYRADTAAAIANGLFTADPSRRAQFLASVQARMGEERFVLFSRLMREQAATLAPARASAGASATRDNNQNQ